MCWVAEVKVAPERPPLSRKRVQSPPSPASSAKAEPVAPPPITHRSNCWPEMFLSSSTLLFMGAPESKCDLGPEPKNRGVRQRGIAAYVGVVLKCRLDQEVRRNLQRIVQLNCFFLTKERAAKRCFEVPVRIANLAIHETNPNAVLRPAL